MNDDGKLLFLPPHFPPYPLLASYPPTPSDIFLLWASESSRRTSARKASMLEEEEIDVQYYVLWYIVTWEETLVFSLQSPVQEVTRNLAMLGTSNTYFR